jgi:hypothetical protein
MPVEQVAIDQLLTRVRGEYDEMPGLRLTLLQAARLWSLDPVTCAALLDFLVKSDFLVRTRDGAFMRADAAAPPTRRDVRGKAGAEAARRTMANAIGVSNQEILRELETAGYDTETITLLEIAPAVQTAWADGHVSGREREVLRQIAERQRVTQDSPAYATLSRWLDRRPPDQLFEASLRAIGGMLEGFEPRVRSFFQRKLIDDCTRVANASGGLKAWTDSVSKEEKQLLDRIATALA